MSTVEGRSDSAGARRALGAAGVIVVSSVMFSFISYWRTAAIVLCDLGSTVYYIGGIVEQSIGPAAPWFILAVMLFSYAVRSVYIESCSMFVRGGVYRIVKEAMGPLAAKFSVSALLFDYMLTGPISSVAAGHYAVGLVLEFFARALGITLADGAEQAVRGWGAALFAAAVTLYFFRQNLLGIHQSSDKALKIMIATTIMAVLILGWGGLTLLVEGPRNSVPFEPKLQPEALGFLRGTGIGGALMGLGAAEWWSLLGIFGLCIAFGHSILGMSGLETLAQVYREVQSPKLPNLKKASFVVFAYSLLLTAGASFLAVLIIPDDVRIARYADNLIGGLAMYVWGPVWLKLLLNGFVVVVGALILSGAVNTAIIGSNAVLNRVAEDGVIPDQLRKPHPRYGTTHRILCLVAGLQLFIIFASRGNVLVLGEAYAFGLVWSFVFMSASMLVLRFKNRSPREFKVPLNIRIGKHELPVGLGLVFLILFAAAVTNLLTKDTATKWGLAFTTVLLGVFLATEHHNRRRRPGPGEEHLEKFNKQLAEQADTQDLGLTKPYRKLVAIRSPGSMHMLEKALAETDPETTDLVVMTAKLANLDDAALTSPELDRYDQQLMTAVVARAEQAGKHVQPLIVPTNNPLHAILQTARDLGAQEVVLGASNKYTAEEQLDQVAFYWLAMHAGQPAPLTVRVLSRNRDLYFDLGGGNRIPKISEREARSVAELRAAGVGVDRVLLAHDGTPASSDLFQAVLTMLDPQVTLCVVSVQPDSPPVQGNGNESIRRDIEQAHQLRREVEFARLDEENWGPPLVEMAEAGHYDLIVLPVPAERPLGADAAAETPADFVCSHASCRVFVAMPQLIPSRTEDQPVMGSS